MTEPNLQLTKPPIVEAIVDIDCDLPTGQRYEDLESPARDRFIDRYPKLRKQFLHRLQLEAKPEGIPSVSGSQGGVQAFQFMQEDEKQLVQVRREGFSFNRLEPYSNLDDYLPEIQRTWKLYSEIASPILIREVRLRYINRLMLPLVGGQVELNKFLQIAPGAPEGMNLTLSGFLYQQSMLQSGTGNTINLVLTAQFPDGDRLPVVLDLTAISKELGQPEDEGWILQTIQTLRTLKNQIFEGTVTEECLKLFL